MFYDINIKMDHSQNKWNYSLNITESLNDSEVIKATNPFTNEEASDKTIVTNEHFSSTIIYAFLDMCIFLSLNYMFHFHCNCFILLCYPFDIFIMIKC